MAERVERSESGEVDGLRRIPGLMPDEESHRLIHERMRLGIVSALSVNESVSFRELRDLLGATDGNLSVHARRLEEGGLIRVTKQFVGRTPRTMYRITAKGRRVLQSYLAHMESLIDAVRGADA